MGFILRTRTVSEFGHTSTYLYQLCLPESESEYFTGDTSIDIHSPGPIIAKTSL